MEKIQAKVWKTGKMAQQKWNPEERAGLRKVGNEDA